MRNALSWLAVLSAGALGACSGPDDADTTTSAPSGGVVLDASAETRAAIGVASWRIRSDATSMIVSGYDPQRSPIVTFEYRVARAAGATTIDAALDAGTRHPTLHLAMRDGAQASTVQSSLEGDTASKAVLVHMVADLRSGVARPATTITTTTTTTSLRPLDVAPTTLVNSAPAPLIECDQLVTDAAANAGQTTTDCSADPSSPACTQGATQAPADQDKVKQCKDTSCTDSPPRAAMGSRRAKRR